MTNRTDTERITPERIAEGRELMAKATPGPWRDRGADRGMTFIDAPEVIVGRTIAGEYAREIMSDEEYDEKPDDARLIVWLRNKADTLLDAAEERERLRERVDDAQDCINGLTRENAELRGQAIQLRAEVERLEGQIDAIVNESMNWASANFKWGSENQDRYEGYAKGQLDAAKAVQRIVKPKAALAGGSDG